MFYRTSVLNLAVLQLEQNRLLHGALHAYLNRLGYSTPESQAEGLEHANRIFPGFSELILVTTPSLRPYITLQPDTGYTYFFSEGWPIQYQDFMREQDLVPAGVWHLNSGEHWERALRELQEKPELGIRTMEDLDVAVYGGAPVVLGAIGTHEALLTKPLLRTAVANLDAPVERLNMRTGQWELDN